MLPDPRATDASGDMRRARLVLLGSGFVACLVIPIWLLIWLNVMRQVGGLRAYRTQPVALPMPDVEIAQLPRATAAKRINLIAQHLTNRTVVELPSNVLGLPDAIKRFLAEQGSAPAIVYLAAAGSVRGEGGVSGSYLVAPGSLFAGTLDASALAVPVEALLEVFRLDAAQGRKRVLMIDLGPPGPGYDPAVAEQAWLERLIEAIPPRPSETDSQALASWKKKWGGFTVICSTAPWQFDWVSDGDAQTVFGHHVADALAGRIPGEGPNASSIRVPRFRHLASYVRSNVAKWAVEQRRAVQTPLILGDDEVDFRLPRLDRAVGELAERGLRDELALQRDRADLAPKLKARYERRDALERRAPYRWAPQLWQSYQRELLAAEQAYRLGSLGLCQIEIDRILSLESKLAEVLPNPDIALGPLPSLGLERRSHPLEGGADPSEARARAFREWVELRTTAAPAPTPPASAPETESATAGVASPARPPGPPESGNLGERPVEGRFLEWVMEFANPPPRPSSTASPRWRPPAREALFRGVSGAVFRKAMEARRRAEIAAAGSRRIRAWIGPLVEDGDRARRRGEDLWFAACDRADLFPEAEAALDRAIRRYDEAAACDRAYELVQKVRAEARFLFVWKLRADLASGSVEPFSSYVRRVLGPAAVLAHELEVVPPGPRPFERLPELLKREADLRAAFDDLEKSFLKQMEASPTDLSWPSLDTLLAVPMIPSEKRMGNDDAPGLLELAILASGRERLSAQHDPASLASATAQKSGTQKIGEAVLQGRGLTQLGRDALNSSSSMPVELIPGSGPGRGAEGAPGDPLYWRYAHGWAMIELGLLSLGGLAGNDPGPLDDHEDADRRRHLEGLRQALADPPPLNERGMPKPEWRASFLELVQGIEDRWARTVGTLSGYRNEAILAGLSPDHKRAILHACAALPPRFEPARQVESALARTLATEELRETLLWDAERWLEDGDPISVVRSLEAASRLGAAQERVAALVERARQLSGPNLLALHPKSKLVIGDVDAFDWPLVTRAAPVLPRGLAIWALPEAPTPVDLIDALGPASGRLAIKSDPTTPPGDESESLLVLEMRRRDFHSPKGGPVPISAWVFYRGRWYPQALTVELAAVRRQLQIKLRTDHSNVRIKPIRLRKDLDQFEKHPFDGYLHPNSQLPYFIEIVNTSDTPQVPLKLFVSWKLGAGRNEEKVIELQPIPNPKPDGPNQSARFGHQQILASELPDPPKAIPLEVSIRDAARTQPARTESFRFQRSDPESYLRVTPRYVGDVFEVRVERKLDDPIAMEITARVAVDGGTPLPPEPSGPEILKKLGNGNFILLHGEWIKFRFRVPRPAEGSIVYHVDLDNGASYPVTPYPVAGPPVRTGAGTGR